MTTLTTHFASPGRVNQDVVSDQYDRLKREPLVQQLLNSSPEPIMVLNRKRQVILVNDKLVSLLGVVPESLLGQRPGEIFHCVHANEEAAGCGTSEFCKECGAV